MKIEDLPATMGKAEFAMKLYDMDDPEKAARKLRDEYNHSPALQRGLKRVGYKKYAKELGIRHMKVYFEVMELDEI